MNRIKFVNYYHTDIIFKCFYLSYNIANDKCCHQIYITFINTRAALNVDITKSVKKTLLVAVGPMFLFIFINHAITSTLLFLYIMIVITFGIIISITISNIFISCTVIPKHLLLLSCIFFTTPLSLLSSVYF